MKRKVPIATAVTVVVIALVVTLSQRVRSTPSYQGIPVSEWVELLYPIANLTSTNEAVIAFRAMGSSAVPPLRKILRTREPWYARWYMQQAKILPRGIRTYLAQKIRPGRSGSRRVAAARALSIVGTNAIAATPDLVIALADPETRWVAAQALADIGGPGITALMMATTNNDFNIRHAAVYGLGQAGTNAASAARVLIDRMRDHQAVRASAGYSITRIGRPGFAAVLEAYSSDSVEQREAATNALKAMNMSPWQIVSSMMEFTTNSSPRLRQNSLEALNGLGPNHPRVVANNFKAAADADVGVRTAAARALAQANSWSTNATLGDLVAHLLGRQSTSLRSAAVETLTGLLSDPELSVREAAQQSMASLDASNAN